LLWLLLCLLMWQPVVPLLLATWMLQLVVGVQLWRLLYLLLWLHPVVIVLLLPCLLLWLHPVVIVLLLTCLLLCLHPVVVVVVLLLCLQHLVLIFRMQLREGWRVSSSFSTSCTHACQSSGLLG
jgi:hypothetical protein